MVLQTDASKTGWGASCQGLTTRGVWSKEERSLHINVLELLVVKLALLSFTKKKGSKTYTLSDRQYNSIKVFEKDGRCEVFGNDQIKQRDLGLSSVTWDHSYHKIPPKQSKHNCRQRIEGEDRFFRVETQPKGVSRASSMNGEPSSRFISILD